MESISIETQSKCYHVFLGSGSANEIAPFLQKELRGFSKVMIITDETVGEIHLSSLLNKIKPLTPIIFQAPSGEACKTFEVYYSAISEALKNNLDRKSVILAFGGGAVGDLAGFVAATYMRGIAFIQIPTTILAHDSSVGGKVAVNHPLGKNMIGAFYQPEAVFYDLDFLKTLSPKEKRSGFAEVIKHALIQDKEFYQWLLFNVKDLSSLKEEELANCLKKGIKIKGSIVSQDERENGLRAVLNFGHTLGHAIESELGYGKITHGEAVMIGMAFALDISMKHIKMDFNLAEFRAWAEKLGYQLKVPAELTIEGLLKKMLHDKKSIEGTVNFILLEDVGKPVIVPLSEEALREQLVGFKQ